LKRQFTRRVGGVAAAVVAVFTIDAQAKNLEPRVIPEKPFHSAVKGYHNPERVVVKFREGESVEQRGQSLVGEGEVAIANSLIQQFPGAKVRPTFTRSRAELRADKEQAESNTGKEMADLGLFFHVDLPKKATTAEVEALVNALNSLAAVELAYIEAYPAPAPRPDIAPTTPSFQASQGYLKRAPRGLDANFIWTQAGGTGAGMKVIDLEYGWAWTHEDLKDPFISVQGYQVYPNDHHGTAVLGILVGQHNGFGVAGFAPDASYAMFTPYAASGSAYNLANAINQASANASTGDVILLEQQWTGPIPAGGCGGGTLINGVSYGYVPMEWDDATYNAIRTATANNRVIVEAAGNGGVDLDHPSLSGRFNRNPAVDSGAIIVGAGSAFTATATCFSTYGSRVDVRAWGESVVTGGYGGLFNPNGDVNQYYTSGFGGTSSASALVAGAATSLQGALKAYTGGLTLIPPYLRAYLTQTGSPQVSWDPHRVGPQPNLKAALVWVKEQTDIYSLVGEYYRDILRREGDTGGINFWSAEVQRMLALNVDAREAFRNLGKVFFFSAEYNRSDWDFVGDLYRAFLQREPDSGGWSWWYGQMQNNGLNREAMITNFMFAPEFNNYMTAYLGNIGQRGEEGLVVDAYRGILGRLPDTGGFMFWRDQMVSTICQSPDAFNAKVREIVTNFLNSQEYANRGRNNGQYVADLYDAILSRGADYDGFTSWRNKLDWGWLNRAQLRDEFLNSPEYWNKFWNTYNNRDCS
jgi:hypothetical protein